MVRYSRDRKDDMVAQSCAVDEYGRTFKFRFVYYIPMDNPVGLSDSIRCI